MCWRTRRPSVSSEAGGQELPEAEGTARGQRLPGADDFCPALPPIWVKLMRRGGVMPNITKVGPVMVPVSDQDWRARTRDRARRLPNRGGYGYPRSLTGLPHYRGQCARGNGIRHRAPRLPTSSVTCCAGLLPASRCGASAAGWRCSMTSTPPGGTPTPRSPPSGRALQLVASIHYWQAGLIEACFAPRPELPSTWMRSDWLGEGRSH